jgi:hypothetical protein
VKKSSAVIWLAPSLVLLFGAGRSMSTPIGSQRGSDLHSAVELSVGARLQHIGLCGHARISTNDGWDWSTLDGPNASLVTTWDHTARTFDAGLGVEVRYAPVFVMSWVGAHVATGTTTKHQSDMAPTNPTPSTTTVERYRPAAALIWGVQLGLELTSAGPYQLAVFADIEATTTDDPSADDYAALTVGFALHR